MANLFMTRADAISCGFVGFEAAATLLTHPRYPGFLFKVVNNYREMLAVGGVLCTPALNTSRYRVAYFGETMLNHHVTGSLGKVYTASGFKKGPAERYSSRVVASSSTTVQYSDAYSAIIFEDAGRGKTWHPGAAYSDLYMIGVISKADGGFFLDCNTDDRTIPEVPIVDDPALVAGFDGSPPAKIGDSLGSTSIGFSGHIYIVWRKPAAQVLPFGKNAVVADAPTSLRTVVSAAFDTTMASYRDDEFEMRMDLYCGDATALRWNFLPPPQTRVFKKTTEPYSKIRVVPGEATPPGLAHPPFRIDVLRKNCTAHDGFARPAMVNGAPHSAATAAATSVRKVLPGVPTDFTMLSVPKQMHKITELTTVPSSVFYPRLSPASVPVGNQNDVIDISQVSGVRTEELIGVVPDVTFAQEYTDESTAIAAITNGRERLAESSMVRRVILRYLQEPDRLVSEFTLDLNDNIGKAIGAP